ncbi:MAG: 50S ribosomal protein L32 [Sphaerochaetaceae bacterium]|nr:50S ribosomal protein L32 [Spirochaetales bacterium]MDY3768467.1 50S ribosomal protein L32 [Sphaerochaetaceae bacterium]MDY5967516.1 50S ribosomal protein L32 [Sphaerochaetaceae bacterium]
MATPKFKTSKSRAASRKAANMKLRKPSLSKCGNCGNMVLPHHICPVCGFYDGKEAISMEDK